MSASTLLIPTEGGQAEKGGIVNDFMYGSNVASSHIYIRMGFLRKVYGLLSVQLLVTTLVTGACAYTPALRDGIHSNPWLMLLCLPVTLMLLVALHVKRHHVPINFFLLGGFTVVEAITVAVVVSMYEVESVVKALVLTALITVSLTAYTLQTKRDFSKLGVGLFVGLFVIIGLGLMNIFIGSEGLELAIAGGSAIVFSFFIVYDTQVMMNKLSPEEYILATINLYLDIINLFLDLLRIFGERRH